MLEKQQVELAEQRLSKVLRTRYHKTIETANEKQLYFALASIANKYLFNRFGHSSNERNENKKTVHYMSIEFLIGRSLQNNLWSLELEGVYRNLLQKNGKSIDLVYKQEKDAGLGNGGLGRLASCYLDSLARLGYPAVGHTIKYEYGLFSQKIVEGRQIETPDDWLDSGSVWLHPREDLEVEVLIGGTITQNYNEYGLSYETNGATIIKALPYDMLVGAYGSETISTLRLWEAKPKGEFNLAKFNQGEFLDSMKSEVEIESINKVLYPSDNNENGRRLRLIQQYFLVSASMQNILQEYFETHTDAKKIPEFLSVHINDTHPVLCVPELMRLLMDKYGLGWDDAWAIVQKTVSYTNHTILNEALEIKSMSTIERVMPRIALIIRELDRRFRIELQEFFKNDFRKIEQLSIVCGNNVYMANLAVYASHHVNGVSKIHSHILKTRLFQDYAEMFKGRFTNITNGITHRRWLSMANLKLDELICKLTSNEYYTKPELLSNLEKFEDNEKVLMEVDKIKLENKKRFADYLRETQHIDIDPEARFDVQVKRIHEYKRQLLNVMRIIYIMNKIRENPDEEITKQVFIFAGKAASGYHMAKRIIKLINELSVEIDRDPVLSSKIKVVFVENFNVSVSEILMPATEVSEQISLAGREASGTGNMKAVMNGALMLCTVDGANIEICDVCGHENMFEFGLSTDEVEKLKARGYNPMDYYIGSERVRSVVDKLNNGIGNETFTDIVDYLLGHSDYKDSYLCLADFDAYLDCHEKMDKAYRDRLGWNKKSLHAISQMGYFSSDRAIEEYAKNIWNLTKNEE